jgi:hypothetical protein
MRHRSPKAIRAWIASGIALVSLSILSVADAPAATLSGRVFDLSNYTRGVYHVYVLRLNLTNPLVGSTTIAAPGLWKITNVPNGNFFIVAWRDVNGNFIPSRGEPIGFNGFPFPSRVTVQGQDISGCDVTLQANNLGAEIRGRVLYNGAHSGRIWVAAHTGSELEFTTVRGTPWTMVTPGDYQTFVLDHGSYFVTAFMDLNGNLIRDVGEPFGTEGPLNVIVTPGVTYTRNITLDEDSRSTPVAPTTWSKLKSLYQN